MAIDFDLNDYLDSEELDSVRAMLACLLMDHTGMDGDEVYSLVFREGKRITWH